MEHNISELFCKVALKYPDQIALTTEHGKKISYIELYKKSKHIADQLQSIGITPFSIIAIYMTKSIEMIVVLLGILMARCIYLPIDLRNPKSRLEHLLNDSNAVGVFTQEYLLQNIGHENQYNTLEISGRKFLFRKNITAQSSQINNDTLYLMYTSGSTGQPKGVLGTHSGLFNRLHWMYEQYPIAKHESLIFSTSFSFVDSVAEIFLPLLYGSVLHVPSDVITSDPLQLTSYIYSNNITRLVTGPTILSAILDHVEDVDRTLGSLSILTLSGQEVQPSLVNKFRKFFPNTTLLNLYGSTEVAADALCYEIPKHDYHNFDSIPIGKPIKNTGAFILNEKGEIIKSINKVGEICISGINLAQGYLNQSKIEKNGFTYHPLHSKERIYKTGDIGYINKNNEFIYIGRLDHQYKVNGQKINRGEIEKTATELEYVSIAALVMQNEKLVLYVELTTYAKGTISNVSIMEHLKSILPQYMLPNKIIIIDSIPLNQSGKTDYIMLAKNIDTEEQEEVLENQDEQFLVGLFKEILKLNVLPSSSSNFFELGGNSLLANILLTKIKQKFGAYISPHILYKYSTPKNIATIIKEKLASALNNSDPLIINVENNNSNTENSFIFFPSILGNNGYYRAIIQQLLNFKSYEISYDYTNGINYKDMEDLANICAQWIKSNISSSSKLFLVGWSFGGVLAYAVTEILSKYNIPIGGLIMLDSYNPELFCAENKEDERRDLYNTMLKVYEPSYSNQYLNHFDKILEHNISILWKYKPKIMTYCPTLLIKASTYNNRVNKLVKELYNGWKHLICNQLQVCYIQADHFNILDNTYSKILYQILINEFHINIGINDKQNKNLYRDSFYS